MNLFKVEEIFIDATYNISKTAMYFYVIIDNEFKYEIPLNFILMKIENKKNTHSNKIVKEALTCNRNFYFKAKQLGLKFIFIHTDKN